MTTIKFPITYQSIELPSYNPNIIRAMLGLKVVEKIITQLPKDQLLIKMQAASCNPSDIAFIQGGYNIYKPLPCVPGFEGTGIIVEVGEALDRVEWLGKRVSCFTQENGDGTWAEYLVSPTDQIIQVDDTLTIDQAACFFINPFTAFGLFEIAQQHACEAIIINAAGSRVADFLFAMAKKHGIKAIGIVRKQQTLETLLQKGFDAVILSTDESFEANLKTVLQSFESCVAYDAVAGEQTGQIANCLPANSEIVVYGGLSGQPVSGINPMQLIFKNIIVSGFNLNQWMEYTDIEAFNKVKNSLTAMITSGEVQIPINISVKIHDVVKGMRQYLGSMSEGKMLIHF